LQNECFKFLRKVSFKKLYKDIFLNINKKQMLELIRDWLFSARQNRYIYRKLSPEKEIEIDIDGTVYMHLTYEYNPVHFRMLKNQLDSHFQSDGEHNTQQPGESDEFYYKGDVTI
jgi:hypothetical protein